MKQLTLVAILALILSGCAGDSGLMNISPGMLDGEQTTVITGQVKDASVQKEISFLAARVEALREYRKMYAQSGFNVKFELVEVAPGVKVQVMKEVSFKERPEIQAMPETPSEHPAWKTTVAVMKEAKEWALTYTGIKALDNVLSNSLDSAQPKYYGNYNPQTAAPYIVEPTVVTK